jgi:hypothetical protein
MTLSTDRIWVRVVRRLFWTPDGCWIFRGSKTSWGYGNLGTAMAHRVSWEHFNGPIPDGLYVCHRCDVPACCNPAHLWLGSAQENNADRDAKGRHHDLEFCTRGHPRSLHTIIRSDGRRRCHLCKLIAQREWRARKRSSC